MIILYILCVILTKMNLSEEQIQELEDFITTNQPSTTDCRGGISNYDLHNGTRIYNELKLKTAPYYELFGKNGFGYTGYALYKSRRNEKIYMIESFMQTLRSYVIVDNEDYFGTK